MTTELEKATKLLDPVTPAMKAVVVGFLPHQETIAAAVAKLREPVPGLPPGIRWWEQDAPG